MDGDVDGDVGRGPRLTHAEGARLHMVDSAAVDRLHPRPAAEAHKYSRGVVGVAAGSARYPGAAVLCVGGALAAGAGMVHHAGDARAQDLVLGAHPAALVSVDGPDPERTDAWVVGPGLGSDEAARARVADVVTAVTQHPATALVLDASALDLVTADDLRELADAGARVVLTPHAGEWARLRDRLPVPVPVPVPVAAPESAADAADAVASSEDGAGELARLRAWTAARGVTVLLKGLSTLVVAPDGEAWLMRDGGAELGVAGTGDVLAGVLGGVLGAEAARASRGDLAERDRPSPAALAAAGAWLHAVAGTAQARGGSALADTLPAAVARVVGERWWGAAPCPR